VNRLLTTTGRKPAFEVMLAGLSREVSLEKGAFSIRTGGHIRDIRKTDLIIIPAIEYDFSVSLKRNEAFVPWISERYAKGSEVASICSGAFLLACTGLLAGRHCSTHWVVADAFRRMFPEVNLVPDKIITDEHGIYSSGGAYSFLNLMLYLVEKFCGRETAIHCAKLFEIDMERSCQSPFTIFLGQKDHEDEAIMKAQHYMENNVQEKISVDELASRFALSKRNFERRFKKATSNTPVEYLQRVRMEAAKKKLETGSDNIHQVMFDVGYSDIRAFRSVFKRVTGLSPVAYRSKYNPARAQARSV
jgi:transcriptional regulator GlxA family with amidase domain